ncbi:hypothetical protein N7447_009343 [Penicillium robsamsonii]|uniref:uncharacterized protein n=1 Tax=Penicillium robsamsonii TaxID=1792511 RepID=UPI0025467A89|nr:uncharacterized protein N7447_009343 [Penicillium robsamsonii]KAJ5817110.1 hypothetical protein N7447_009343 [Penicillium robsamsonii]
MAFLSFFDNFRLFFSALASTIGAVSLISRPKKAMVLVMAKVLVIALSLATISAFWAVVLIS